MGNRTAFHWRQRISDNRRVCAPGPTFAATLMHLSPAWRLSASRIERGKPGVGRRWFFHGKRVRRRDWDALTGVGFVGRTNSDTFGSLQVTDIARINLGLGWHNLDRQVSTCITWRSVGDVFKALADPTRRTILDELTDRNGQTLFEICARLTTKHELGSSRQAISQHLDVLEAAGLVKTRREGRYKFHDINTTPLEPIVERWLKKADNDFGAGRSTRVDTGREGSS
jgi:DNA-binding transcriptional ArsR family regulator